MHGPRNRVYIASKLGPMESQVVALKAKLQQRGYVIPYDWTQTLVPKPFEAHRSEATAAAEAMVEAVKTCDILIVLCAPNGLGMHIETGVALGASLMLSFLTGRKLKAIYIVGEESDRSVFYFHDSMARFLDVESLLKELPIIEA